MCVKSDQAMNLYTKACRSQQAGEANLAEVYYLKSWFLLEQVGGAHLLTAANALNAVAFIRWSRRDYEGALRLANQAIRVMEAHGKELSCAEADLIRDTSWDLIDQVLSEMSLSSETR
jgi:hypothetical protein